jgi:hypothetical protein
LLSVAVRVQSYPSSCRGSSSFIVSISAGTCSKVIQYCLCMCQQEMYQCKDSRQLFLAFFVATLLYLYPLQYCHGCPSPHNLQSLWLEWSLHCKVFSILNLFVQLCQTTKHMCATSEGWLQKLIPSSRLCYSSYCRLHSPLTKVTKS